MDSGSNLPTPDGFPDEDRQQFCVSWNSYQSNMHNAFPKLLSSEQFVDVTLACDGGSIKCHKVVLSACSDYLERLLLEIPCTHPIIFLRDMRMWELQALVEFMYRGEVYVEKQQINKLMSAAEALQVRGLSNQGNKEHSSLNDTVNSQLGTSATPDEMSPTKQDDTGSYKGDDTSDDATSTSFMETSVNVGSTSITSSPQLSISTGPLQPPATTPNYLNTEHTEAALHHLQSALSACEATLTESTGMVKMEPDEQFSQQEKPYSISLVPSNCNPGSPFPAIEGYQRRQRRSEEELKQASDMVARGMTFQVASEKYKIPISTIRFYMVRKGILQRRKRGRGAGNMPGMNSQPSSPASPPFHMMNFRLPESLNSSLQ